MARAGSTRRVLRQLGSGMSKAGFVKTGFAALTLSVAMIAGFAAPASAEFFGCNDRTSTRTYTNAPQRHTRSTTHEYSAQSRTRHTYYRAGTKPPPRTTWSDRSRW